MKPILTAATCVFLTMAAALAAPVLTITATHVGNVSRGQQQATFTVVVGNSSATDASSGTISVTENLPADLRVAAMSGRGWNCTGNICQRIDALAPGAYYPALTVLLNVSVTAPTLLTNQVVVQGGSSADASVTDPITVVTASNTATADLVIRDFTAPNTAVAGTHLQNMRTVVVNQGQGNSGPYRIGYYLGKTPNVSSKDFYTGWSCDDSTGRGSAGSFTCLGEIGFAATLAPGTYYLAAIVDDDNKVAESDETNNIRVLDGPFTITAGVVPKSDLVVTKMSAANTGVIGGKLLGLTATVQNQGQAAAGTFRFGFYLGTSATFSTTDYTGFSCRAGGLDVNSNFTCFGDLDVSASLSPGTYYIGAIADDLNEVAESNETNNSRASDNGTVTLTRPAAPTPQIQSTSGVVNGANFQPGIASGTWITIRGVNLSTTTRLWNGNDFSGNNMPTTLDSVRVFIDGRPAYVYYISPTQLNVLAPGDPAAGSVDVQVTNSLGASASVQVNKQNLSPALFTFGAQSGRYAAANIGSDYAGPAGLLGSGAATRPARSGEVVSLYATGLGQTNPAYPEGQGFPGFLNMAQTPVITFGGAQGTVTFAALVSPGVYQINARIPSVNPGDQSIVVSIGGVQTTPNTVFLPTTN